VGLGARADGIGLFSGFNDFGVGPASFGTGRVGFGARADGIGLGSGLKASFGTWRVGLGARANGLGLGIFGTGPPNFGAGKVGEAGALGTYGTRPSTALRTSAIAIGFDTAYILAVTTYYLGKTGFQRRNMTIFS